MERANNDALFERLARLQEQLPAMQELGESITRVAHAEEIVEASNAARQHAQSASFFEDQLNKLQDAIAKAKEDGDDETLRELMPRRQFLGRSYNMNLGLSRSSEQKAKDLLSAYSFADVEEARNVHVDQAELDAKREQVKAFFAEYKQVLATCAASEGLTLEELGISGDAFEVKD